MNHRRSNGSFRLTSYQRSVFVPSKDDVPQRHHIHVRMQGSMHMRVPTQSRRPYCAANLRLQRRFTHRSL